MTREPIQPTTEVGPSTRTVAVGARYTLARNLIALVAWGFVAAVVVQVYLAGLGVFRTPQNFELHVTFGHVLEIVAIALLVLLLIVRASRGQIVLAAVLTLLTIAQNVFIQIRETNPEFAALHPVNGVLILVVAIILAQRTWRLGGLTEL
jgi:hypothetical protein